MSALEQSVTLEDVFAVIEAKRVPLAPELAGYLTLEIADGTDAGSGDVDPKTVFISEEGTVALVRPKKDGVVGDAEMSIRALLSKLLEASGSGTPALSTAARRTAANGLPALVEELEAALIPVNRAAGRRALARLAREVRRVLFGVGRNASSAPNRPEAPHARPALRRTREEGPAPEPKLIRRSDPFGDEATTAKRTNELSELAASAKPPSDAPAPPPSSVPAPRGPGVAGALRRPSQFPSSEGTLAGVAPPVMHRGRGRTRPKEPTLMGVAPAASTPPGAPSPTPPPARTKKASSLPPPPVKSNSGPPPPPPPPKREALQRGVIGGDEVDNLLDAFAVSGAGSDRQVARDLKAIAGLSPTPPPPDAKSLAELTKDVGRDLPRNVAAESHPADDVDSLLALADASGGMPQPKESAPLPSPAPPPRPEEPRAQESPRLTPRRRQATPVESERRPEPRSTRRKNGRIEGGPRAPKTALAMLVLALIALIGGAVATWRFAPQVFTGRKRQPATPPSAQTQLSPAAKCKVALVLTEVPSNAEILLRVGQAPADIERMPVGTRLELVATAEGYAPRRAVIKSDSPWDKTPDGKPRIEIPIQLDPSKAKPGQLDAWPAAEPGSQVGGSGAPGTVHVVSNVRGAEVWLLAGLGPEARIDQLRCDADIDVLLAGLPTLRKRLHVGEKEIAAAAADEHGTKVVSLSAR